MCGHAICVNVSICVIMCERRTPQAGNAIRESAPQKLGACGNSGTHKERIAPIIVSRALALVERKCADEYQKLCGALCAHLVDIVSEMLETHCRSWCDPKSLCERIDDVSLSRIFLARWEPVFLSPCTVPLQAKTLGTQNWTKSCANRC